MSNPTLASWLVVASLLLMGCDRTQPKEPAKTVQPPASAFRPIRHEAIALPNLVQAHPRVYSGGQPHGAEGFRELRELGVKTIISVDGATPDVAAARAEAIACVHLPVGYNGIDRIRALELAKAIRELPGPVYLQCHHGKHRSPTAAAVACVGAGLIEPGEAPALLKLAGTGENYLGLHRAAAEPQPLSPEQLAGISCEFPEVAQLPDLAEAMVELDHRFERLGIIAEAGWVTPPDHPDLSPAHEALLVSESFAELIRNQAADTHPAEYREVMVESNKHALELVTAIGSVGSEPPDEDTRRKLDGLRSAIAERCKSCHQNWRDNQFVLPPP